MVNDAEAHAAEDKRRREVIEARNRLDNLIYNVEKTLAENREKLSAGDLGDVEGALEDGRKALESEEPEVLDGAIARLEKATHKLAEAMYKGTGQAAGGGAAPGAGAASEDEVIDAEVVDGDKRN